MEPWRHSTKGARNRLTISTLLQCARHTESYPPIFHYYRPIIFCNFFTSHWDFRISIDSIYLSFHSAYNIKRCKDFSLPPVFVRLLATLPGARSLELLQVSCALRFSTQTWSISNEIDSVSVWRPLLFSCPLLFLFSSKETGNFILYHCAKSLLQGIAAGSIAGHPVLHEMLQHARSKMISKQQRGQITNQLSNHF